MSDETPTERFDAAGDAPTERLTPAEAATVGAAPSEEVQEERKSRRLILILGIIGAVLLLILILLLVLLLTRPSGTVTPTSSPTPTATGSASASPTPTRTQTATASPTPTPTPTPTQTAAPPPPPSNDVTLNIGGTSELFCNTQAPNPPDYTLYFEWSTQNAAQVYFGVDTNDASSSALHPNLPPNGNSQADFPYPIAFPCPDVSHKYTFTAVGSNGSKVSKSITVTNKGDTQ